MHLAAQRLRKYSLGGCACVCVCVEKPCSSLDCIKEQLLQFRFSMLIKLVKFNTVLNMIIKILDACTFWLLKIYVRNAVFFLVVLAEWPITKFCML